MSKKISSAVLICFLLQIFAKSNAQDFAWLRMQTFYDLNRMESIVQDSKRQLYTAGCFYNFNTPSNDLIISKINEAGSEIWSKTISTLKTTTAQRYIINIDLAMNKKDELYLYGVFRADTLFIDNLVVATTSKNTEFAFLAKFNSDGQFQWIHSFEKISNPNDIHGLSFKNGSIAINEDNNIFITGQYDYGIDFGSNKLTSPSTHLGSSSFITKLDSSGKCIWAKSLNVSNYEDEKYLYTKGLSIYKNQLVIMGNFNTDIQFESSSIAFKKEEGNVFVAKYDTSGQIQWAKVLKIGIDYLDIAYDVKFDNIGDIYVTSSFVNTMVLNTANAITSKGGEDTFILKYNNAGEVIWLKSLGGSGDDGINCIGIDAANNCYVAGGYTAPIDLQGNNVLDGYGDIDIFILKILPNGQFDWVKKAGGIGLETAINILVSSQPFSVYVIGVEASPTFQFDKIGIIGNKTIGGFTTKIIINQLNPQIIQGDTTLCKNTNNVIYSISAIEKASKYIWDLPEGIVASDGNKETILPFISVSITASANSGLIAVRVFDESSSLIFTAQTYVRVLQQPITLQQLTIQGDALVCLSKPTRKYHVQSLADAAKYIWILPEGVFPTIGNTETSKPEIELNFSKETLNDTIKVLVYNKCGDLIAQAFKQVVVKKCANSFYIPTAFSPNGDGLNEKLEIFGDGIKKLDFRIFNRWGELIFVSKEKENTWDGKYNGIPAPSGVYVWKANYELEDSEGKYQAKGIITVVY